MTLQEYNNYKRINYFQLCNELINKYGVVKANYCDKEFTKRNINIYASKHLYIHHIYCYKYKGLSDLETAKNLDYFYQYCQNLCYCNILEHFLLHLKIIQEYNTSYRSVCLTNNLINNINQNVFIDYGINTTVLKDLYKEVIKLTLVNNDFASIVLQEDFNILGNSITEIKNLINVLL